jgi:hypothetical protein
LAAGATISHPPEVTRVFSNCSLSQFPPSGVKKAFHKKAKGVLSFLFGEFFLDCRVGTEPNFCL